MEPIIIYGIGANGKKLFDMLKYRNEEQVIYCFCDAKSNERSEFEGYQVISPIDAVSTGLPIVVDVGNEKFHSEIVSFLEESHAKYFESIEAWYRSRGKDFVEWDRDLVAAYHVRDMDFYFKDAERKEVMNLFWGGASDFLRMFKFLNLQNVVELACGRGRQVPYYLDHAENIILVDILQENIDICRDRFRSHSNITYYKNNGYDLNEIPDDSCTSIFSYDSLVHFEMMDIFSYLKESYRILHKGSYALFHHSNNHGDYRISFAHGSGRHGRNYMSKDLFAYLSYRAGFNVVEQKVIDFGGISDLDCITLLQKPMHDRQWN